MNPAPSTHRKTVPRRIRNLQHRIFLQELTAMIYAKAQEVATNPASGYSSPAEFVVAFMEAALHFMRKGMFVFPHPHDELLREAIGKIRAFSEAEPEVMRLLFKLIHSLKPSLKQFVETICTRTVGGVVTALPATTTA